VAETVRWGVLSTAAIGLRKVIPGMQMAERCDVMAIASRDAARAEEAARSLGIDRSYGSYEALLEDPDVEAVYNPLPNHLHAEWTLRAAAAGKHVLCEKPLAMSSAQAEEMVAACRDAGVLLMEAFMYRLHPQWVRVRTLVHGGAIGELTAIQAFFSYRNVDPENIRNIASYGGGALMDVGCYPINLARMLFDAEPSRVEGAVLRDPDFGTDGVTSAVLDFDGRHATFTCSTRLEPDQRVHVVGTEGRLLVEIPFNIPPDRSTRLHLTAGGDPPVAPNTEVIEIPSADQYGVQGDAFSRAVLGEADLPTPPEDGVANMRVIEAVLASAEAGA
jgi:predicted dehydrogenase